MRDELIELEIANCAEYIQGCKRIAKLEEFDGDLIVSLHSIETFLDGLEVPQLGPLELKCRDEFSSGTREMNNTQTRHEEKFGEWTDGGATFTIEHACEVV